MSDPALAAVLALGGAVTSATFSIIVRKGQRHGNATSGVMSGLIVSAPTLIAALARFAQPAWRLPAALRIGRAPGKRALRACLARHVPRELFERPKQGFGVPIGEWLRGPLRGWAEELLAEARLTEAGLFPAPNPRLGSDHLAGRVHGEHSLWDAL